MKIAKTTLEEVIGLSRYGGMLLSSEQLWSKEETGLVVTEKRKVFSDNRQVKEIVLEIEPPSESSDGFYAHFVFPKKILGKFANTRLTGKKVWVKPGLLRWEHCGRSCRVGKDGVTSKKIG
jgi:hypothetical protein